MTRAGPALWLLAACLPLAICDTARAGAWTEPQGQWQVIAGLWASQADRGFDAQSRPDVPVHFAKLMLETEGEYGWTDWLTLILHTETVYAEAGSQGPPVGGAAYQPPVRAVDNAFEGGARILLDQDFGRLSLQASYRTAGAFNFALSADSRVAGSAGEARLLYGTGFSLYDRDGFFDVQLAERLLSRPRPAETAFDLTMGLWLTPDWMAMAQSFNIVSGGNAVLPYHYYRSHKLQASLVWRLSETLLLQAGGFFSPLGQNALVERGFGISVWLRG